VCHGVEVLLESSPREEGLVNLTSGYHLPQRYPSVDDVGVSVEALRLLTVLGLARGRTRTMEPMDCHTYTAKFHHKTMGIRFIHHLCAILWKTLNPNMSNNLESLNR
jgi:hypothetical protein